MSDRETILRLQKALEHADYTIGRQNYEIEQLTKELDASKQLVRDKTYKIKLLQKRIRTLEKKERTV